MKQTLLLLALTILLLNACSQYVAPTGGKKDTLAPVLLKSTPTDKQRNFNGQTIELAFNEYIRVENANQKILITPEPEAPFKYKARPTNLRLTFDKPFKPNTTYTFNFTDAIKDITENNPALNLKLVFSTGNTIDSLRVGGKVTDIETGRPLLNALVGLYIPNDTLTPTKTKPYYFTRTDSSGIFKLENVKDGKYKVFAFDDKNINLIYNAGTERVAFLKGDLDLTKNIDSLSLQLFPYYNTPPRTTRTDGRVATYTYIFDRGIENYQTHFQNAEDSLPSFFRTPTELTFFNTRATTDTVRVQLMVTDSLGNKAELNQKFRFRTPTRRDTPDPITITAKPANNEDIDRNFRLSLEFSKPVQHITMDSLRILSDSTTRVELTTQDYKWENNQTLLIITKQLPTRKQLAIRLGKGTFISVLKDSSAASVLRYSLRNAEKYGVLSGRVNTKAEHVIVELLDESFKVVDRQVNTSTYRFNNVKPGKYRVRVIIDANNNGRWDSGNLAKGELPESIYFQKTGLIPIKADFEINDQDVDIL